MKDLNKDFASCIFIEADVEQLDFAGPYFDRIFCSASLPYFSDLSLFFKKARRWLKERGLLAFNTPKVSLGCMIMLDLTDKREVQL